MKDYRNNKNFTGIVEFEVINPTNSMEHSGEKLILSPFGEFCPENSLRGYKLTFLLSNPLYYRISKVIEMGVVIDIPINVELNRACEKDYTSDEDDMKFSILEKSKELLLVNYMINRANRSPSCFLEGIFDHNTEKQLQLIYRIPFIKRKINTLYVNGVELSKEQSKEYFK